MPGAAVGLPGQRPGLPRADNRPRRERYLTTRTRLARLPFQRTLEQFGFSLQASIDERLVRELANRAFVAEATNAGRLGSPGVGKTPLAGALSLRAIENWYGACFVLTYPDADAPLGHPATTGDRLDQAQKPLCSVFERGSWHQIHTEGLEFWGGIFEHLWMSWPARAGPVL